MTSLSDLLWLNNTPAGKTIILMILGFGAFGALAALRHRYRYQQTERNWLETVRGRLHRIYESQQPGQPDDATEAPKFVAVQVELRELAEGIPLSSLIGDRLNTIGRMKQARARVNIDALQQSTILKESSQWTLSFPSYVVSLVMMLGLLGTFIGLSVMVVDIQQALPAGGAESSSTQWSASISSLGQILAGKKTAFSATLAGLFFSIVVSMLNFALARAQSDLYDRLERFTTEELLPAVVPAFDDETPWEKLSMQLGDSFEHLQALTTEQSHAAEQLMAVEKAFGTIIANVEAITHRAVTTPLQSMTGEMTNVIGQIAQVNGAVVGLTEKLPQLVQTFRQTHQSTLSAISTAMEAQRAGIERLTHAVEAKSAFFSSNGRVFAAGIAVALLIAILLQRLG